MSVVETWDNFRDEKGRLPPCLFFISMEQPVCDKPAPFGVLVKTEVSSAVIDLCREHYRLHVQRIRAAERRKAAERRAVDREKRQIFTTK